MKVSHKMEFAILSLLSDFEKTLNTLSCAVLDDLPSRCHSFWHSLLGVSGVSVSAAAELGHLKSLGLNMMNTDPDIGI